MHQQSSRTFHEPRSVFDLGALSFAVRDARVELAPSNARQTRQHSVRVSLALVALANDSVVHHRIRLRQHIDNVGHLTRLGLAFVDIRQAKEGVSNGSHQLVSFEVLPYQRSTMVSFDAGEAVFASDCVSCLPTRYMNRTTSGWFP